MTIKERETHLNMVCEDRSTWLVFSDDPTMIRLFQAKHYEQVRVVGDGFEFKIPADKVEFVAEKKERKPRALNTNPIKKTRNISDEVRRARSERMKEFHIKKRAS